MTGLILIGAGTLILGGAAAWAWLRMMRQGREQDCYAEYLNLMLVTTSDRYGSSQRDRCSADPATGGVVEFDDAAAFYSEGDVGLGGNSTSAAPVMQSNPHRGRPVLFRVK